MTAAITLRRLKLRPTNLVLANATIPEGAPAAISMARLALR
jgi:hypothetical protein